MNPEPKESQSSGPSNTDLRKLIDTVDDDLIRLLGERMKLSEEVGSAKTRDHGLPIFDPDREHELLERWVRIAETRELSPGVARGVLRELLDHSRRRQETQESGAGRGYRTWARRIGYQGEPEAYSDLAIQRLMPGVSTVERIGFATFTALFDALEHGAVDCILVPTENTTSGSIPETAALLIERRIVVLDEEIARIEHVLAGVPGSTPEAIRTVRSHSVALQQCRRALSRWPRLTIETSNDTAGAAREIAEAKDPSVAAICSVEAARRHGLAILTKNLADHRENYTRFFLVGKSDDPRTADPGEAHAHAKTSIVFSVRHVQGALAACLSVLADHDINLTRIESCPTPGRPWEYRLFTDLEGHAEDPRVREAIEKLGAHANHVRILGSYRNRTRISSNGTANGAGEAAPSFRPLRSTPSRSATRLIEARDSRPRTVVHVRDVAIGDGGFVLIAGPCAVESREQILEAARMAKRAGARMLRGGAYKPRTSPYSFQGLGDVGLDLLHEAGEVTGLPTVTEVLGTQFLDRIAERADMLQVGARNMQNFDLLRALGRVDRPVLLKRGMSATVDDLLHAAEYILAGGNQRVVLCERGIRTFETATRSTLDIAAIPVLRARTHLPIIVDPSHAAGKRELVIPLALASVAAGADGLIVEAHPRPEEALSDKEQALGPEDLEVLSSRLESILSAKGLGI
jgi:chorismate mutase/prephenate dehydratase